MDASHYDELIAVGRKLLDEHGLSDWTFSVENCQNRLMWGAHRGGLNGGCNHVTKRIAVDNRYVGHPRAAREVILHEIAHALLGPGYRLHGGHGPKFCKLARRLGCRTENAVGKYEFTWRFRHEMKTTGLRA